MVAVVAGVVAITVAARRVLIQIPQRTMARGRQREAARNFIPLRINTAGVMPIIFAQSVIVIPGALAQFSGNARLQEIAEYFNPPGPIRGSTSCCRRVLIMFFTYFYTSIIFNPVDLAENLKKQGGFVPGIKPGAKTAEYIEQVVERITLPGAMFLTVIALMPHRHRRVGQRAVQFGGTSLLIVVGVALDTMAQMQQHLLLRKYDGFMKKGRVRFRGRQATGGSDRRPVTASHDSRFLGPTHRLTRSHMIIVLLGPPGAGKGTQASGSPRALAFPRSATGDVLRAAVRAGTPLGLERQGRHGSRRPGARCVIMGIMKEALSQPEYANGAVLDGVVRTTPQADGLEKVLAELGRKLDAVLLFDIAGRRTRCAASAAARRATSAALRSLGASRARRVRPSAAPWSRRRHARSSQGR